MCRDSKNLNAEGSKMKDWEDCYQKDPNIVSRKIADKTILVPIRNKVGDLESIYTLNEIGARIWELIDGRRDLGKIRDMIIDEFEVTAEEAEKDLSEFLPKLKKIEAIRTPQK